MRSRANLVLFAVLMCALCRPGAMYTGRMERNTKLRKSTTRKPLSDEKLLVNMLLSDYRKVGVIGRPVLNTSHAIDVSFGLGLIQMEVEEKSNMLIMSAWTKYSWIDEYLTWDPEDFGGVQTVKLPHDRIWIPDIMLYNTATTTVFTRDALAVVTYDGHVTWYPHRVFQSSCSINVRYFPFDNQTCHMYFGSWTHTVHEINVSLAFPSSGIDLSTLDSEYNASSKWEILTVVADRVEDGPYVVLTFTLNMKRKMMFSSYILTLPAVFLSFLTLVVFSLPAEDVEKSQLGLAIFGSLLLLLLIVVEAAPPTASAVPLLGVFYCFTTVIVIMSVFLTSIVIKVANATRSGRARPVPKWLRVLVLDIIGCQRFTRKRSVHRHAALVGERETRLDTKLSNGYATRGTSSSVHTAEHFGAYENRTNFNLAQESPLNPTCVQIYQQMDKIAATLSSMASGQREKMDKSERQKELAFEWKSVASILDRLFFWLYLTSIILSMIFLFPWKAE